MPDTKLDFIIVGTGAAGCTVAREILDRQRGTVLLIESGSVPRSSRLRVPSEYLKAFQTQWDWDYRTTPQSELNQRTLRWPAGHALGGSTSINAMIWIEPDPSDFEGWQSAAGPEWSIPRIEAAFQRVRTWLDAAKLPTRPPLHPRMERLLHVAAERGWTPACHPSGFDRARIGIDAYRRMQLRGRRVSAWSLLQREQRQLRIASEEKVIGLLFDGDRVIGVRSQSRMGERIEHTARRGVILCAGALETPRLLMASGLGPREELAWSGIACRVDLPELGRNLQDHLVFPIVYRANSPVSIQDRIRADRREYVQQRTGPRSSNLAELGGFFALEDSTDLWNPKSGPPFQLHITPTHYLDPNPLSGQGDHTSFGITPLESRSRGTIALAQKQGDWDPQSPPPLSIDPHYLAEGDERADYLRAIEAVRGWIEGSGLREWVGQETFPQSKDRDRLGTYVQRFASTIYHYAGSCAIGARPTSCLDESMQVRGIDSLWVCDASAMPRLVGCNPQATVSMMAVRLVDNLTGMP